MPLSRRRRWEDKRLANLVAPIIGARPPVPVHRKSKPATTHFHTSVYVPPRGSIAMALLYRVVRT